MDMSIELLIIIIVGLVLITGLIIYIAKMATSSNKIDNALRWIKAGDYNKALTVLKSIVNKDDNNAQAHYLLGECYFEKKNYEWALPEFKKVLRINKYDKDYTEAKIRRRLADIYLYYRQLEEAQKEFLLVTNLEPNNYKNYFEIGKIFVDRNHADKALPYIQKALEISPNHIDSLFYAGMIKYNMKLFSEALLHLEKCTSLDKSYFKAFYYIGMINFQSRNFDSSLRNFDVSLRDKDFRSQSLFQRGLIFIEKNELQQAIAELEKAVIYITEEDTLARNIRYQLAKAYEMNKDISSAIEQWEKILVSQPDFKDVQEKLNNYAELRIDDKLKDFFIASNDKFIEMSMSALNRLGYDVQREELLHSTCVEMIAAEKLGEKDVRVQKVLVRVYRHNEPLGDGIIRDLVERLKKEGGTHRALCISATGFTKQAEEFADTRPVNIVSGKGLADLFKEK